MKVWNYGRYENQRAVVGFTLGLLIMVVTMTLLWMSPGIPTAKKWGVTAVVVPVALGYAWIVRKSLRVLHGDDTGPAV